MSASFSSDLACVASRGAPRSFEVAATFPDLKDAPDEVFLLLSGGATLAVVTPFGPHDVTRVAAPAFLNLARSFVGTVDLVVLSIDAGSEAAVFRSEEIRRLLFDAELDGQAFRRLALAGVAQLLRETNASLARFFDGASESDERGKALHAPAAAPPSLPVDPRRVYDLFDAAGLNPSGLPDLGLTARRVAAGTPLVVAGGTGDEAYLLAEGRLRVSLRIPGVGEEALAILGVGEIVGEMALIDDAPRSADVLAHGGDALVYAISRDVFRELLDSGAAAGAPLLAGISIALARRLEEALRRTATFRVLSGPF